MHIVHCRVIVDNMCEFQHSSSHVDCNFDARLLNKTRKYHSTKKLRKHGCKLILVLNNSTRPSLVNCISTNPECRSDHRWPVCKHSLILLKKSICSLCHRAFMGSEVLAKWGGQSAFTKISRCILPLLCSHCFASCNCCHDPLIERSAQTRPPFTGFSQLAHPSRCSRSTLTTVCFCASGFSGSLCSHRVCNPVTRSIIGSSPSSCSGVWDPRSVEY